MKVQFKDVEVNKVFVFNEVSYMKIDTVKVSCCKSINAKRVDNENDRTFVAPMTEVEVND